MRNGESRVTIGPHGTATYRGIFGFLERGGDSEKRRRKGGWETSLGKKRSWCVSCATLGGDSNPSQGAV